MGTWRITCHEVAWTDLDRVIVCNVDTWVLVSSKSSIIYVSIYLTSVWQNNLIRMGYTVLLNVINAL